MGPGVDSVSKNEYQDTPRGKDDLTTFMCRVSGSLNLLDPSRPGRHVMGTLYLYLYWTVCSELEGAALWRNVANYSPLNNRVAINYGIFRNTLRLVKDEGQWSVTDGGKQKHLVVTCLKVPWLCLPRKGTLISVTSTVKIQIGCTLNAGQTRYQRQSARLFPIMYNEQPKEKHQYLVHFLTPTSHMTHRPSTILRDSTIRHVIEPTRCSFWFYFDKFPHMFRTVILFIIRRYSDCMCSFWYRSCNGVD
jgi:hypothetical protein